MYEPPKTAVESTDYELTPLDKRILGLLDAEGARTLRSIHGSLETNCGRSNVWQRLNRLVEDGPVEKIDRGLYQLDGGDR